MSDPGERRDRFAAAALQGLLAAPWHPAMGCSPNAAHEGAVEGAIQLADYLIAELDKPIVEAAKAAPDELASLLESHAIKAAQRERDEALDRIDALNQRHEEDEAYRQRANAERDAAIAAISAICGTGSLADARAIAERALGVDMPIPYSLTTANLHDPGVHR